MCQEMLLLLFCDILKCLVTLSRVSYLIKDTANKKYITTNGQTGELSDNIKDQIIFHMYSLPDISRPFSIVSYDNKKAMIVNENKEIVFVDTALFNSYEENKVRCDFRKNADDKICVALSNILDPEDGYKENTEEEDSSEIKKLISSVNKESLKDIKLESFFIWSVGISNKNGGQRIVHKKTGFCLTNHKNKLRIEPCDIKKKHNTWKLKEFRETPLDKQIEDEAIETFSENILKELKQQRSQCDDSEDENCVCDYPRKNKKRKRLTNSDYHGYKELEHNDPCLQPTNIPLNVHHHPIVVDQVPPNTMPIPPLNTAYPQPNSYQFSQFRND